jgi:hypothetical protein
MYAKKQGFFLKKGRMKIELFFKKGERYQLVFIVLLIFFINQISYKRHIIHIYCSFFSEYKQTPNSKKLNRKYTRSISTNYIMQTNNNNNNIDLGTFFVYGKSNEIVSDKKYVLGVPGTSTCNGICRILRYLYIQVPILRRSQGCVRSIVYFDPTFG